MLSPVIPYLMVVINWIIYSCWSDISQSYCSLFLMVFSLPLIKLTINLVVRRSCDPQYHTLLSLQIACRTKSEITFDVAMVAPLIANINAALGFVVPEVMLLLLLMVTFIITIVTDVMLLLHIYRFSSGLIYVPHQSITVMILPVSSIVTCSSYPVMW